MLVRFVRDFYSNSEVSFAADSVVDVGDLARFFVARGDAVFEGEDQQAAVRAERIRAAQAALAVAAARWGDIHLAEGLQPDDLDSLAADFRSALAAYVAA